MNEDLLRYYESELTFIRHLAGEFAQKYPKVAGRLDLDDKESGDPHIERLIQAFAMLTGRIRQKIDDEYPEIVESLLNVMYPHYLRPIPTFGIGQFRLDAQQGIPTEGVRIARHTVVTSRPSAGGTCTFRTCYPVTLWPLHVTGATLGSLDTVGAGTAPSAAAFVLKLQIASVGEIPLDALPVESLRFFLNGEGSPVYRLHELLCTSVSSVQVRARRRVRDEPARLLPPNCIQPVGFNPDEALLPYPDRSFAGYRLLQEYFSFAEKFLFVDLHGFNEGCLRGLGSEFDLIVSFRDNELREHLPSISQAVRAEMFQLGCTPIVNIFEARAEPIRLTHTSSEYRVIADRHRESTTEIYSVDRVITAATYSDSEKHTTYEPFYSLRHNYSDPRAECFWYDHRRPSLRKDDEGTEVYLSLVDSNFDPALPPVELITAVVTCTNRDLAARLNWRKDWGELQCEAPMVQARCLTRPTHTIRPPMRGGLQWRLISHVSVNRLSVVQGGLEALQEILRLYCFEPDDDMRKRIIGLTSLTSRSSVAGVLFDSGFAFCRGLDVEVEFDEDQFAGSGAYLLASVLERFFGLYSALNSFTRFTARSQQRRSPIRRWPPRIGEQKIL